MNYLNHLLDLALAAAPWLVLGLLLGGLFKALLPTRLLEKHLQGNGIGTVLKAAALGAPLPLCSCGVIPAALGLRKAGASKPATASFLVSTPETGVDSIAVTYAMLGGWMAMIRPLAALVSATVTGLLVALFDREPAHPNAHASPCEGSVSDCSSRNGSLSMSSPTSSNGPRRCDTQTDAPAGSCCHPPSSTSTTAPPTAPQLSAWQSAHQGIRYAFGQLLQDIAGWLLLGLIFAAAIQTWLPPSWLAQWGQGFPAMLIMVLVGIPMYICATASTPIAAGLLLAGVSPGAALVLLLTGPATNVSTLGVISQQLGKRSMMLYLIGVISTALLAGLLLDAAVSTGQLDIHTALQTDHAEMPLLLAWLALGLLFVAWGRGYWQRHITAMTKH